MAEQVRYVDIPGYATIVNNLAQSSSDISTELGAAKEAANLHIEKHQHIRKAEELLNLIEKDVAKFVRMMPIKQTGSNRPGRKTAPTEPVIDFSARPTKPIMTESDRELIARSHRALANLQKNLSELRSELGKT